MSESNDKIDVFDHRNYRDFLICVYQKKQLKNRLYSLRAFSRDLGLSAQAVGNILAGRYGLSSSTAITAAKRLKLDSTETKYFTLLIEARHARSKVAKAEALEQLERLRTSRHASAQMGSEQSEVLSDWVIPAVSSFIGSEPAKIDVKSLSHRLGVKTERITKALQVLTNSQIVEKLETGEYLQSCINRRANSETPSPVIRSFHKQVLEKAISKLDEPAMHNRKSLSTILSFPFARYEEAKREIESFHSKFLKHFAEEPQTDSVMAFTLQFFRLDKEPAGRNE